MCIDAASPTVYENAELQFGGEEFRAPGEDKKNHPDTLPFIADTFPGNGIFGIREIILEIFSAREMIYNANAF